MKNELVDEALSMIRTAGFKPSIVRSRHLKFSGSTTSIVRGA